MPRVKLFTHKDDMDGRSCPMILAYVLGISMTDIDISYETYHTIDDSIAIFINGGEYKKFTNIFITDMGISLKTAEKINEIIYEESHVLLYDHHDTNLELNKFVWANVKPTDENGRKISATKIVGVELARLLNKEIGSNMMQFITLVSDYDTYNWKAENNPEPKKLHSLFNLYGPEKFVKMMSANIATGTTLFSDKDELLLEVEKERVARYINERIALSTVKEIEGFKVATVYSDYKEYNSELGNTMCERLGVDVAAMVSMGEKTLSFRSISNDFHLGNDFASKFGGGGHDKSAGAQITPEFADGVLNQIFGLK